MESLAKFQLPFFYRNWQADPNIHIEMQTIQNSQNNLEKEQNWRNHTYWLENLLHRYNNQDTVVVS